MEQQTAAVRHTERGFAELSCEGTFAALAAAIASENCYVFHRFQVFSVVWCVVNYLCVLCDLPSGFLDRTREAAFALLQQTFPHQLPFSGQSSTVTTVPLLERSPVFQEDGEHQKKLAPAG